jgi:hypothetical protein
MAAGGPLFYSPKSGVVMRRYQALSFAVALAVWAGAANATPPDLLPDNEHEPGLPVTWIPVEARNHATGASGPAAVLYGAAHERGRTRPASLRVECFDGVTAVHMDADGLRLGPWAVAVTLSLDGGRFVAATWQPSADGTGLVLTGERAVAFASELYGKAELRLAVVRPLSVPFLFTFTVAGAEAGLGPLADRCHWSAGPAISDAGR